MALLVFIACMFKPGHESATGTTGEKFKNCKMISLVFETDSETVSRLVPEQFRIPESTNVTVNIGIYNRTKGPQYYEMYIQVPAMINGKVSSYTPLTFVDSSEAARRGSNIGLNSKPAKFELILNKDKLKYRISVSDTTIAIAEYTFTRPHEKLDTVKEMRFVNSLDSGKVKEVVITDFVMTKASIMSGNLTLNLPPLGEIPILNWKYAFYFECDFNSR